MLKYRVSAIDRLIRKLVIEIILIILAVIGSYFVFANSNLSASASIAEEYSTGQYDLQVMVGREELLVREANLLDKTLLTVRNPNKDEKYVDVNLIVTNPSEVDLSSLYVDFKGIVTDTSKAIMDGENYKLTIYSGKIDGYENLKGDVLIYSDKFINGMKYTFSVNETYYR